ncbi:MAG: methyltransferase [Gammaproteobacteria bacterium]|jgi:leader peptidase (prepilin peptidase)/N-methyltransferase|nr:methyltransferase [Gammaproteobacteria bacterium]
MNDLTLLSSSNLYFFYFIPIIIFISILIGNILNWTATFLPYALEGYYSKPYLQKTSQLKYFEHAFPWGTILLVTRYLLCKKIHDHRVTKYFILRCMVVEIATIIILSLLIYEVGASWLLLPYLTLACGFLLLAIIDSEHHLLPDAITLPLLWVGLFVNSFDLLTSTQQAIWGAIIGYSSLYSVSRIFKHLRGIEGLGLGDCKLFAIFGAWWGVHALLPTLFIASLVGSVIGISRLFLKKRGSLTEPIPFGPYLILGVVLTNLYEYY